MVGSAHSEPTFIFSANFDEGVDRRRVSLDAEIIAQCFCDFDVRPATLPQRADQISVGFEFTGSRPGVCAGKKVVNFLVEAHTVATVSM